MYCGKRTISMFPSASHYSLGVPLLDQIRQRLAILILNSAYERAYPVGYLNCLSIPQSSTRPLVGLLLPLSLASGSMETRRRIERFLIHMQLWLLRCLILLRLGWCISLCGRHTFRRYTWISFVRQRKGRVGRTYPPSRERETVLWLGCRCHGESV
jgi:hypothetical protein